MTNANGHTICKLHSGDVVLVEAMTVKYCPSFYRMALDMATCQAAVEALRSSSEIMLSTNAVAAETSGTYNGGCYCMFSGNCYLNSVVNGEHHAQSRTICVRETGTK